MNIQSGTIRLSTLFLVVMSFLSCSSARVYSNSQFRKFFLEARNPTEKVFIVFENGDTIRGEHLKLQTNPINGNITWVMDGEKIRNQPILSYQDDEGYNSGNERRLLNGPLAQLYAIDYSSTILYNTTKKMYLVEGHAPNEIPGPARNNLSIHYNGRNRMVTYNVLMTMMEKCPAALTNLGKEFANTVWLRKPNDLVSSYKETFNAVKYFNEHCR